MHFIGSERIAELIVIPYLAVEDVEVLVEGFNTFPHFLANDVFLEEHLVLTQE